MTPTKMDWIDAKVAYIHVRTFLGVQTLIFTLGSKFNLSERQQIESEIFNFIRRSFGHCKNKRNLCRI